MQKILILDKDGTLTTPKSGNKFVQSPDDQKIIPGMDEAIAFAKKQSYRIAVASNQMGIACGFKTDREAIAEFNYLHQLFPEIDFSVFCPDDGGSIGVLNGHMTLHIGGKSSYKLISHEDKSPLSDMATFRKPQPGMLQYILSEFGCNKIMCTDKVLYIGDRPEDEQAAMNAGIPFVWADVFCHDHRRFL